jgi:hypothetical protein
MAHTEAGASELDDAKPFIMKGSLLAIILIQDPVMPVANQDSTVGLLELRRCS